MPSFAKYIALLFLFSIPFQTYAKPRTDCSLIGPSLCDTINTRHQNGFVSFVADKPVMGLFAADLGAKVMDYRQTEQDYRLGGFHEANPLVRPLLGSAALYAEGAAYALGAAWLGHKMRESHNPVLRKLWWLPQSISIGESVYGYAYTRSHYHR